jgi:hypothetical protein
MPESLAETAHTSSDTATERETLDAENLTTPATLSADSLAILGSPLMNPEENDKARTEASFEDTSVLTELALEAVSVTSNSTLSEAVMVKTARNAALWNRNRRNRNFLTSGTGTVICYKVGTGTRYRIMYLISFI